MTSAIINTDKLRDILGEKQDSYADEEDWISWCDSHEFKIMSIYDVEDFWNEKAGNTVCVDSGSFWLVLPREFAEKILVLGIP